MLDVDAALSVRGSGRPPCRPPVPPLSAPGPANQRGARQGAGARRVSSPRDDHAYPDGRRQAQSVRPGRPLDGGGGDGSGGGYLYLEAGWRIRTSAWGSRVALYRMKRVISEDCLRIRDLFPGSKEGTKSLCCPLRRPSDRAAYRAADEGADAEPSLRWLRGSFRASPRLALAGMLSWKRRRPGAAKTGLDSSSICPCLRLDDSRLW